MKKQMMNGLGFSFNNEKNHDLQANTTRFNEFKYQKTKINCHTNYFQIQERKIKPKNKVEKDWRRVKVNSSE